MDGDQAFHWYANIYNGSSQRTFKIMALCTT
jgi:hypothetical protein